MYQAELIMRLTGPDGKVLNEKTFAHREPELEGLQIGFVEAVFSRANDLAEKLFDIEVDDQKETPPPAKAEQPAAGEKKKTTNAKRGKSKDDHHADRPAEPGGTAAPGAAGVGEGAAAASAAPGQHDEGAVPKP